MDSTEIIRRLRAAGWEQVRQKGSHVTFKHPTHGKPCTVPHPKKDLPIGTVKSIEKQTGIKLT